MKADHNASKGWIPLQRVRLSRNGRGSLFDWLFGGFTLVEVMIATAIATIAFGAMINAVLKGLEFGKWQSNYETACSYGEQALEYAMYVPYSDLSLTTYTPPSANWVSNGLLYSTATATNYINTTQNGAPFVVTNVTYLATQNGLPLDDLGYCLLQRTVTVTDRSALEPSATNLNYKLITVSNVWTFMGRTNPPIVYQAIRDAP